MPEFGSTETNSGVKVRRRRRLPNRAADCSHNRDRRCTRRCLARLRSKAGPSRRMLPRHLPSCRLPRRRCCRPGRARRDYHTRGRRHTLPRYQGGPQHNRRYLLFHMVAQRFRLRRHRRQALRFRLAHSSLCRTRIPRRKLTLRHKPTPHSRARPRHHTGRTFRLAKREVLRHRHRARWRRVGAAGMAGADARVGPRSRRHSLALEWRARYRRIRRYTALARNTTGPHRRNRWAPWFPRLHPWFARRRQRPPLRRAWTRLERTKSTRRQPWSEQWARSRRRPARPWFGCPRLRASSSHQEHRRRKRPRSRRSRRR